MKQILRFNKVIKSIIIIGDLFLLNIIFISLYHGFDYQTLGDGFIHSLPQLLVLLNLVYLLCNYSGGVILHKRIVRPEHIVRRALRNTILHALVFISLISLTDLGNVSARFFICLYSLFYVCLVIYRLTFRYILKKYRKGGGNSRSAVLVGSNSNMAELYHEMTGDPTTGFRVIGYFEETPTNDFPKQVPYLGHPQEVVPFLQSHSIEQVYCCLPSKRSHEIVPIINYCENHDTLFQRTRYPQLPASAHAFRNIRQHTRIMHPGRAFGTDGEPVSEKDFRPSFFKSFSLHHFPVRIYHHRNSH